MTEQNNLDKIVQTAVNALEDIKAKDIAVIDTQDKTPLFAKMIVATGESTRQVKALANNVAKEWKDNGVEILSSEGNDSGEWVLIDAGDCVVHCMLREVREYYDLETLWGGAKPV